MAHLACESKLPSVVRSSMHPCPGNWLAHGHAVVYYARVAHACSAGIKCRRGTALPVTASCLSSLPGFEFRRVHVRMLPVTCS